MKKYLRYGILFILLLIGLSLCGTTVLGIFGFLMQISFENILYSGFQVGFLAAVLLLAVTYLKRKKS